MKETASKKVIKSRPEETEAADPKKLFPEQKEEQEERKALLGVTVVESC